jgi:hypothetical protein
LEVIFFVIPAPHPVRDKLQPESSLKRFAVGSAIRGE